MPYLLPAALVCAVVLTVVLVRQRVLLTRLRRQQTAFERSEQRFALVLQSGGHGFWDWNLRTGEIERNDFGFTMLGYNAGEIPPSHEGWMKLAHPDDAPAVALLRERVNARGHDHFSVEYRMRAKDGQWHWIYSSGRIVERDAEGRPLRASGTHTDITARKQSEEERVTFQRKMLEAQKLESLGLLAGGVAHDFNNLLAVILGNVSLARLPDVKPAETARTLAQIETAARRAADLCRQMLAYAGRGRLTAEPVDLNALVTETTGLLHLSLGRSTQLEFSLADPLPAIEGDPSQLRQVVMNLVLNASEAIGSAAGRIHVATALRRVEATALLDAAHGRNLTAGEYVCLEVTDDGCGMTEETRAKIFDPFFTTKSTGRGLGLAAVLGIVRAHQGAFFVRSEPGKGSAFSLYLPPVRAAAPDVVSSAASAAAGTDPADNTILVADDDPGVLTMAAAILRHHGYPVVTASDGHEAVSKFSERPADFAAVLLDLTMPGLDGTAALAEIRAIRRGVRVLLMSGFSGRDILAQMPPGERPGLLQKPFSQAELLSRIGEVIAGPA
jgi:PAS domain S-box-containing protein